MSATRVDFVTEETGATPPTPATPDQTGDRPEWLPANFKTPEELAASYAEAQATITRMKQGKGLPAGDADATPPPPSNPNDASIPDPSTDDAADESAAQDEAAKKAAKNAGFSLDAYQDEFNSTGDVSEDSRAKIAKGLESVLGEHARTVIDQYIDGRKTSVTNDVQAIKSAAGGDDAYGTLVGWAAANLPKDEIAAYNQQVNSGNRAAAIFAVEGLRSRFERANGREPALMKGTFTPPGSGLPKFRSTAEMTAAMRDPRYQKDEAYRAEVASRIP